MTLKERQWKLREEAILDAACELLAKRAAGGVCVDQIAARAGVSKPTLYQHFASKDELIMSVSLRMMRRSEEALAAREPGTPALEHLTKALREGLARRAGMWSARVTVPREMADASAVYQRQRAALRALLTSLVDEAKAQGDMDPGFPTPVVVRMLQQLYRGDYEDLLGSQVVTEDELAYILSSVTLRGLQSHAEVGA